MGEMFELGLLIGLIKACHMGRFLVFPMPAVIFKFQNASCNPSLPYDPLHSHVGLILIFVEDPL
jgi:hypothetical protein